MFLTWIGIKLREALARGLKVDIMGVGFDNINMDEAVRLAVGCTLDGGKHYIVTPNSEIVYEALRDGELMDTLNSASVVLPDGAGIIAASKILKTPLREKVAGVDFAVRALPALAREGKKLFLFGGKPGVAERAAGRIREISPGITVCGFRDGYFSPEEEAGICERINDLGADVIYVCLGAPKQEQWISRNRGRLNASLLVGLGGSIDILAGETKRAPEFFIRLNLEWLHRLIKQPSRLGRMMRLPKFILKVLLRKGRAGRGI
ncbi:MAG: WecB/TagA/CpsF family glycosyltransferase [Oscillospiraceae bacterium]|jgi:N-acetylglucosaminyldiphosphoundecaprenol N-acetyl-beta-D-mannosaminyltransferase|nr:WecB/TagA/CpsF family glycosyltransferase [Oscillospiraceae bacterium]